jgi:hypothetical protein
MGLHKNPNRTQALSDPNVYRRELAWQCQDQSVISEATGLKIAAFAVKKLAGKRTVRERLIKRLKEDPEAPSSSWRLRWRLMKLLKTKAAVDALYDQNEHGVEVLSAMVATHVLTRGIAGVGCRNRGRNHGVALKIAIDPALKRRDGSRARPQPGWCAASVRERREC